MTAEILYRASDIAQVDRIPVWSEVVWNSYVPLSIRVNESRNFTGKVERAYLGTVRIVTSGSRAQHIVRTPRLISQDTDEYLMLGLQLKGKCVVEQHGRQAVLQRGDFVFWDTRRPYDINFPQDWEMAVFQFPRTAFTFNHELIESITACTLSSKHGMSRIAASLLLGIAAEARCSPLEHKTSLLDHTLGLLTLSVDQQLGTRPGPVPYDQLLLRRIETYINNNLMNPDLRVSDIARDNGLTVPQLYRLFNQSRTTPVDFMRRQRLSRIKDDLANPRMRHITIASIARKWGFTDTPYFNRAFKQQFNATPREFRA